jgi:uncharacterized protein YjbI with pentapeptide repeats
MAKITAANDDLRGSQFEHSNMAETSFNDVNLTGAKFYDINFSDVQFAAAQIGGSVFRHIGPPPGTAARQRPVTFVDAMLCDSTFRNVDLSGVSITDCNLTGMTIDGVLVTELLAARAHPKAAPKRKRKQRTNVPASKKKSARVRRRRS